jgi:magnesium-protoporphyrin IX monomethyl ester (oxidative) cyclase
MKKSEMFARGAEATASYLPPLGLGYIAAYLRAHGHLCEIYDGVVRPTDLQVLCEHAMHFDIVGISISTAYFLRAAELLSRLQRYEKRPPVLVGGPHATTLPETLLEAGADVAIIGEGEYTCLELVSFLAGQHHPVLDTGALAKVAGIVFRDANSGNIVKTMRRPPIADLDSIPLPARDLLPMHMYGTSIARSTATPSHSMLASRGCTGVCSFCNHSLFGKTIRRFSPARVVEEFFQLRDLYKAKSVALFDDNFIEDAAYAHEVLEQLIIKKFRLPISIEARADAVSPSILKLFKKAGGDWVALGFESGSQRILDSMKKKLTLEQMREAVAHSKEAGLKIRGYFMMGMPTESYEDIRLTINFAKSLDIDVASFTFMVPFPGTRDYMRAQKSGKFDPHFYMKEIISEFHFLKAPIYVPENMTSEGLLKIHKSAYSQFYFRPSVIVKKLLEVQTAGDVINLFKGGYTLLMNALS